MTQDERWILKYNEVVSFIETNHRNPSRHRVEDLNLLNWLKANRKVLNRGEMKPERREKFAKLQKLIDRHKRINQYD